MPKSKFTDEQIIYALKQAELGSPYSMCAASTALASRPSTASARSTAGLKPASCGACGNRRTRTGR